jgi:hypothetical protein
MPAHAAPSTPSSRIPERDLVVHNDLAEREGPDAFPATIHFS